MFTPEQLEVMPLALERQFRELESRIMTDIVRRIRINGEFTSTADLQLQRLSEIGTSKQAVKSYIQSTLQLSDKEVDNLYKNAVASGYGADKALYSAVGKDFIPYGENKQLQQLVTAVSSQTKNDLKNITQSLGFAVRQPNGNLTFKPIADYYQSTLDKAVLDITSGGFDYNTVLKRTVNEMTNSGLRSIDYASGHSNRVDVAVRRAVMTGVNQVTAKITEDNMRALETEYVEVSWHRGARPTHQVWQGKIYCWKEKAVQSTAQKAVDNSAESGIINTPHKIADSDITSADTNNNIVPTIVQDLEGVNQATIYAKQELEIGNVNTDKLQNAEVMNVLLKQLKVLKDKYNKHFYQMVVENMEDTTFAFVAPDLGLHLNAKYLNNQQELKAFIARMLRKKLLPNGQGNPEFLITHEFMHLVSQEEINNPRSEVYKILSKKKKNDYPSKNSKLDDFEFTADSLAMVDLGNNSNNLWNKLYKYFVGE